MQRVAIRAAWILAALLPWALLSAALGGCSLSPSADFITALGKDPATVSVSIVYPYGTVKFCRTAITNGKVACTDNGIQVESTPPSQSVGVQLVPVTK